MKQKAQYRDKFKANSQRENIGGPTCPTKFEPLRMVSLPGYVDKITLQAQEDLSHFQVKGTLPSLVVSTQHEFECGYSRFRGVEGVRAMADVLSAVEHSVGQSCQKVPGAQVASHRPHGEARAL